jgi:hypothetical protein
MLQLIDNVLSFDPPSRIDDSPCMEMLTAAMTEEKVDVVMEEEAAGSNDPVKPDLLHGIYREEVFNDADNLINDAPSPLNTTQDSQLMRKRRRKRLSKFKTRSKGSRNQEGSKMSAYTYQQKLESRAAKVNATVAIILEEFADYNIDESTPTLSKADQ